MLLVDLGSGDLLLQLVELSLVDSLEISELLLLLVVECELLVFLFLLVIFELYLKSCFLLEGTDQLWVNDNVGDVTLFEHDSVRGKLRVQILHHCVSHIRLQIKDLRQPDTVDECSHVFFDLGCKQFIESTCP